MRKKVSNNLVKRVSLQKEQIIRAAVKIADEKGIDGLSMRKLGQILDVEAMALYHHFPSKDALIDCMVDSVHAEIVVPQSTDNWRFMMHKRAVSALSALTRHRWAASLMESRQNPGAASMQLIDATVKCLRSAGFTIGAVAHALSVLDAYTFGFAMQLRPAETIDQSAQNGEDILKQFPFGMYPHVGELIQEHVVNSGYRTMDEFEIGLELVLKGIEDFWLTEQE